MATINVYQQYFGAKCTFNGTERHAANVLLISDSEAGNIKYEVAVSFFPHETPDDFGISYDAYFNRVLSEGPGRRSKKKEEAFLETLQQEVDKLAAEAGGTVFWDQPLIEARRG